MKTTPVTFDLDLTMIMMIKKNSNIKNIIQIDQSNMI